MFRDVSRTLRGAVEVALALALLVVFLSFRDLPLVDLPQHALQLANWLRIDAGDASATRDFELNFRTPYLLAYPILRGLCVVLPIVTSLKLVFWASIVAQAVTLRRLCQQLGYDPWLGLLGYPLALGYSFCFGFVSFCAALPLVYLACERLALHRESPTLRSGAVLATVLALLLVAHGVALGFWALTCAPLLLVGRGNIWQRCWPLLSPPLLAAIWIVPGRTTTQLGGDLWEPSALRFVELPAQLVGIGAVDQVSTALGVALLAMVIVHLGKPRSWLSLMPLALSLLGYGLFPLMFHGAGPLHPRFLSLLVPALLLGFEPRVGTATGTRFAWRRWGVLIVSIAVPIVFAERLPAYNDETAGLYAVLAELPVGARIRPLVFDRGGRAFPGIPAHLHLPAYYAVEKGGSAGYSFAMYSISVVRFRPGVPITMGGGSEWDPGAFDAEREAADYDYFIVKSSAERSAELFPGPSPAATLKSHQGDWWCYVRPERRSQTESAMFR